MSTTLLISAPFGTGHTRAAQALAAALGRWPSQVQPVVLELPSAGFLGLTQQAYLAALRRLPTVYRHLYARTAHRRVGWAVDALLSWSLEDILTEAVYRHWPGRVVVTHPFPGRVLGRWRSEGRLRVPLTAVLTDFAAHALWVHPGIDCYCAPLPEVATDLVRLGAPPARVKVTGIPVAGVVHRARAQESPVGRVVISGGGLGLGPVFDTVESLTALLPALQVTAVAGHNSALLRRLHALAQRRSGLVALGYTERMPELLAQADVLVTKPGGLTCAEAVAAGTPLVLLPPLPGQEEENAAALQQAGVALAARDTAQAAALVRLLIQDWPDRWRAMASQTERLAFAAAALRAAGLIWGQSFNSWRSPVIM